MILIEFIGGNIMQTSRSPYISKIKIKNFRNYKDIDVTLNHKQIIIGENNVGKTNFLRAIQLILDPKLSDEDRYLQESDFFDGLENPMNKKEKIEISIEIKGYEHNKTILSTLQEATVSTEPPTLRLTYEYYPAEDGTGGYQYRIYQGTDANNLFTHYHRRFLNIKVIPAIRDVESEMKSMRKSPINQLINQYDIRKEELEKIATALKEKSDEVLSIDELIDLTQNINSRFSDILGTQVDSTVSLETIDIDPNRVLNTLKLMIGQDKKRSTSNTSLGLNNILYISLILLSLEDKTIPSILKEDTYDTLALEKESSILPDCYEKNDSNNYILKKDIQEKDYAKLYSFMDNNFSSNNGFTLLAIEEPESHLHPALQRIIYKDVMKENTSILMTTHSPHITSVAPINSIVHLHSTKNGTVINTTASLKLDDRDKKDLERYIDVKRGEIYFGRGVILIEGVAEEYLIPSFAEKLGMSLDKKGIICCNINSTNFKPYVQFLDTLGIPYVVITDGDYYIWEEKKNKKGILEPKKKFGILAQDSHEDIGYDGNDRIKKLLIELKKIKSNAIPEDYTKQDTLFKAHNFFIGVYTMEIDIMSHISNMQTEKKLLCKIFNELTLGGTIQKGNFKTSLENGEFVSCLNKIESSNSGIGKGRFSQHLSVECTKNFIPSYIQAAIETIFKRVDEV